MGDHRVNIHDDVDDALRELAEPCVPPEIGEQLESELMDLQPVRTRPPRFGFIVLGIVSSMYLAIMFTMMDVRPDIDVLPRAWLVLYGFAWLASFVAIAYLAVVPARGHVTPNWYRAGFSAAIAGVGFVLAGFVFKQSAAAHYGVGNNTLGEVLRNGLGCLSVGMISTSIPLILGALLLRGRLPVGASWAGAGLGAAGGSLGGLFLHFTCSVGDGAHLGLIHGGLVVLGALLGALLLPRTTG